MTHSAQRTLAVAISLPASSPAVKSGWPTNVSVPTFWYALSPTLTTTTGTPEDETRRMVSDRATTSGMVATIAAGCPRAASMISEACACGFVTFGD